MTACAPKWSACCEEPALPVDRDARHLLGQARRQPRGAGDVPRLRADGVDAAEDHVVDRGSVDARALDERLQHTRGRRGRPGAQRRAGHRAFRQVSGPPRPEMPQPCLPPLTGRYYGSGVCQPGTTGHVGETVSLSKPSDRKTSGRIPDVPTGGKPISSGSRSIVVKADHTNSSISSLSSGRTPTTDRRRRDRRWPPAEPRTAQPARASAHPALDPSRPGGPAPRRRGR